jgi:uncharacterized protein
VKPVEESLGPPVAPSLSDPAPQELAAERIPPWPPWTAPAALFGGLALALVAGLLVDLPALALGVNVTSSHVPGGLEIADTIVQDAAFVVAAVFFAGLGGRTVRAWQFGLRPPRTGWKRAAGLVLLLFFAFLIFSLIWGSAFHAEKDKLLEQLGTGESIGLLVLSATLTCVIAPICEEFLFRGFIFTALRNWHGTWPAAIITGLAFGGVHVGSAPVVDLVPLAGLGFGLCLLYRYTGSLYPCIVAHSLNNSIAFGSLEGWRWQSVIVLLLAAFAAIGLIALGLMRAGVITPEAPSAGPDAFGVASGG